MHSWIRNGPRIANEVCCPKIIDKDKDAFYMRYGLYLDLKP